MTPTKILDNSYYFYSLHNNQYNVSNTREKWKLQTNKSKKIFRRLKGLCLSLVRSIEISKYRSQNFVLRI
jgi:hypothetical protein